MDFVFYSLTKDTAFSKSTAWFFLYFFFMFVA